jgi:saccharopine dehydrogenase (NADP+, L-glutamate forming)
MKNVLIVGAGKSSTLLIEYLLERAAANQWKITIGDLFREQAEQKVAGYANAEAVFFDIHDPANRDERVAAADLVISLLPAHFHTILLRECIRQKVDFLSASYVSDEIKSMSEEIEEAGILVLKECGLDPGIDHMSAMAKLDELRDKGAKIKEFETFTGGLVAPESDNNPWRYKFTWNPRNVVVAGQGVVQFKHNGRYKYIPYHRLFSRYEMLEIPGFGFFEGYPNRDSLKYRDVYGLRNIDTIYRGTMRRPGFCKAWDALVQLGLTDDSFVMEDLDSMSYRDFTNSFLWWDSERSVELKLAAYLKLDYNNEILDKIRWLGLLEDTPIPMEKGTPAQVLQTILEKKWAIDENDKDMIVMLHKYVYELDGVSTKLQSSMVVLGEDSVRTGMAKTVGLPLGIAARLILEEKIDRKGIVIPTTPDIYKPVLKELESFGVEFSEYASSI